MAELNPFEIYSLPQSFRIDSNALEESHVKLQKKVHPDRFATATDAEKRIAQQWSAIINDAYKTLSDPVERAKLLLRLAGRPLDEDSSGSLSESFLMHQLERREMIAEAKMAGDKPLLESFKKSLEEEKNREIETLENVADWEKEAPQASEAVRKVMFLNRQLKDLE